MNTIDTELLNQFLDYDIFKANSYGNYYDCLNPQSKDIKLLNNISNDNLNLEKLLKNINKYGTISPEGPIIETPEKIKVSLKQHQKRTLYEMTKRENGVYRFTDGLNVNLLCDNVGSGKSLCVLSLIANSKLSELSPQKYYSDIKKPAGDSTCYQNHYYHNQNNYYLGNNYELHNGLDIASDSIMLESNVIIVPHNVYNQWKSYIEDQTTLKFIGIGGKRDYKKIGTDTSSIVEKCKINDVILVKSTMYKGFRSYLDSTLDIEPQLDNSKYTILDTDNLSSSKMLSHIGSNIKIEIESVMSKINTLINKETVNETTDEVVEMFSHLDNLNKLQEKLKTGIDYTKWKNDNKTAFVSRVNVITGYCFERVFVDEVDSIRIPAFPYCYAKQIWFITSSINNITYPKGKKVWDYDSSSYKTISTGIGGTGFLKDIITNIFRSRTWSTKASDNRPFFNMIRNNNNYVDFSMKIPEPIIEYVQCLTPAHLLAISGAINSDALKALNAGDFEQAVELLGCAHSSEEDLVNQVTKKLVNQRDDLDLKLSQKIVRLDDLQIKLEDVLQNISETTNNDLLESLVEDKHSTKSLIQSTKSSIENFKSQIKTLDDKINGIKSRMTNVAEKDCPVCKMSVEGPCITPCCKNVFCLECLTMAVTTSSNSECPICRSSIDMSKINIIVDNQAPVQSAEKDPNALPTKMEKLMALLEDKSKRFMVFSEFDGGLSKIETELAKKEIRYSGIKGTSNTISKTIDQFKNKEFNVLLLNAKYFGAGLNLQFTDEIIIYHRMSKDLEKQVIGRAQRLGRTDALKINYLCYENEY